MLRALFLRDQLQPLRGEGSFGGHTGYYTLSKP
jgi:hypothetical protein